MSTTLEMQNFSAVSLSIPQESLATRAEVLEIAELVVRVENEIQQTMAIDALKVCKDLAKRVESSRVLVKEEPLKLCRKIDSMAKEFRETVDREAARIERLLADYQRRLIEKQRAEEAARYKEAQRLEQERVRALQDARKAETEEARKEALNVAVAAVEQRQEVMSAVVAPVAQPEGIKACMEWTFEVLNAQEVFAARPDLCEVSVKTAAVKDFIRGGGRQLAGLRIFEEVKVRTTR